MSVRRLGNSQGSECGMLKDMPDLDSEPVSRPEMDIKAGPKKDITLSSIRALSLGLPSLTVSRQHVDRI